MRAGRISCLQDHCHLFQPSRVRIFTRSYARRKNLDPQEKTALKDDSKDTKSTLEQAPPSTPTSNEDHDNPANRTTSAAVRWLSNRQTRVGSQLSRVNIVNTELCSKYLMFTACHGLVLDEANITVALQTISSLALRHHSVDMPIVISLT